MNKNNYTKIKTRRERERERERERLILASKCTRFSDDWLEKWLMLYTYYSMCKGSISCVIIRLCNGGKMLKLTKLTSI